MTRERKGDNGSLSQRAKQDVQEEGVQGRGNQEEEEITWGCVHVQDYIQEEKAGGNSCQEKRCQTQGGNFRKKH